MPTAIGYTSALRHLLTDVDYAADTIKVALVSSGYTPNQDGHEFYSSITGSLATGNGYIAGGQALASKTVTSDAATNQTRLDAADASWTATAGTQIGPARYAVIYKDTGTPATSPLLGLVTFDADTTATGAPFTLTWDPTGLLVWTQAA